MIKFADNADITELKSIWKICFGDTDEYINLIFSKKFKAENTLLYLSEGRIVACLQMQQYNMRMYDSIVPFYYMVGLCTLTQYRGRGYMGALIEESFNILKDRKIALSILVPAEESLIKYYNRFGYEETFGEGDKEIELKRILTENTNLSDAFEVFDRTYQKNDFCVLKDKKDFDVIVEDYVKEGYPPKFNLRAMSKIIDQKSILSLYAKKNNNHRFIIETNDPLKSRDISYLIDRDKITEIVSADKKKDNTIVVDERYLTKMMFGYKLTDDDRHKGLFNKHNPIINLMLE